MKNYFIIHGSFGNGSEHYFPWLKNKLKEQGEVICPDFPIGVGIQNFENWAQTLNQYKHKINSETIFIGRSIGPIFAIKYLLENNLRINKLISVSGFNNYSVDGGEYDKVNISMFVDNLEQFKRHCNKTICIISENDPYVKFSALKDFSNKIADNTINIGDGGHFNADSGYGEKFEELLKIINS
jgi:predicted alpha/beta hydrolase family esterase